ncbi:amidohydrolase family protein [Actinomadura sp. HBU206391]|uniref:amidohydrolase family protein n=1 Tax=Actinomadura sp. HBU206391 TaxID=2731692 RepID=UPI0016503A61|nr:amidohydrolase family protein [Actinomadura sp. HBU206391]MBC6460622.1 amidohydrolase family protein [Actinomadura sp. HBU206391]
MIVDAHVHVFRPFRVHPRVVDDLAPAERDAPVEDLRAAMAAAGVDRAVLVPLGSEDDYVAEVLAADPDRFAAVAVADPDTQGRTAGVNPVRLLHARLTRGFGALRTQWLGEPGRPLAESPMLPVLRELAVGGLPLWSYLPPEQLPLLRALPDEVPGLRVVLNHLGFAPHDMRVDAHGRPAFDDPFPPQVIDTVMELAACPDVHLMFSGQYALSGEAPPYSDLSGVVAAFAGAYGADRMLWASDYPWTRERPGLAELRTLAERMLPDLSEAELAALHGGTALRLFPSLASSTSSPLSGPED